jgi:hypothetical protein
MPDNLNDTGTSNSVTPRRNVKLGLFKSLVSLYVSPTFFPRLRPPINIQRFRSRLLNEMSTPLNLLFSSGWLSHRTSKAARVRGSWLYTVT